MKKRKGSLLQRMMAVLLSAVLVTGMVSNAAPQTVLAKEESGAESVSGNDAALSEEEQAGIPEEAPAKLAAWTVVAQTAGESAQVMTAAAASGTCGDNVTWTLADGVLTISGTGEMTDYDNVSNLPPWEDHKTDIVSVVIEDGVTSIGTCAFQTCSALTSVTIRDGVTSIGGNAFENCSALTSVTIPESVTEIGDQAFCNCSELATVMVLAETPPTVGRGVFGEGLFGVKCKFVNDNMQGIHVPKGSVEDYKNAWTALTQYITDAAAPAEEHKHNGVTFTAWTATDSLPTDVGNYYLTENVTLTETWTVPNGTTSLCLNGKTISASGNYRVITINISATLNLYDCGNTGNITGGKDGGVWNDGAFCMYGGKISGNATQTYNHGGGVMNNRNFYMYGGEISGNTASMGFGGGVETYGEFRMYGGKISGNTAGGSGGGVHTNGNGKFIVGGGAVISGNTYNGKENNVYLKDGQWIEVDSNLLSGSANIGVTTATAPTEGNPVSVTGHNKGDCSQYFHSDNPVYEIVNANDVVQLVVKPHTHSLTLTPAKPAACAEDGNEAYYVCGGNDGCGKWFSDAAGTQEITDKDSVVIPKTGHDYDEIAWGYKGADGHAHKCLNCDAHDTVQPHTPGAAATESTPQTCTVCGYIIAPATGTDPGSGTVTPEVKPGANVPATGISTSIEELKDMLLTEEEKRQVQNGTDIRIVLEVQDAGNTVSGSDQAAIQQALNSFTVGQYLNIDLYKLIGSDRTNITETEKEIRIVITVPDSLKNADSSKARTFAVIRVHDGRTEILTDLDNSADTITIGTDRFSTYAIVYKDTANGGGENSGNDDNHGSDDGNNGGGNDNGNNGNDSNQNNSGINDTKQDSSKDSEPKTGDSAPLEIYATLAMIAGFAYLLLYFADRKRGMSEETKRELVSRLVGWAKRGGRIRKCLALAAIFVLLVYYHGTRKLYRSISKKTCSEWEKIYGE